MDTKDSFEESFLAIIRNPTYEYVRLLGETSSWTIDEIVSHIADEVVNMTASRVWTNIYDTVEEALLDCDVGEGDITACLASDLSHDAVRLIYSD